MNTASESSLSLVRQTVAQLCFLCGQSACYWGVRTAERSIFRIGLIFFNWALRIWPGFALAYYRRGLVRGRELGQYREALRDLGEAIKLEPEWPEPYLQRGLFQRFQGNSRAAMADLEQYLSLGGELYWRLEAERQLQMIREEMGE